MQIKKKIKALILGVMAFCSCNSLAEENQKSFKTVQFFYSRSLFFRLLLFLLLLSQNAVPLFFLHS